MPPGGTRTVGALASLVLAGPVLAQTPVTPALYDAVVRLYASGEREAAVARLSSWPERRLERELRAAIGRRRQAGSCVDCEAALMLHTDCLLASGRAADLGERHRSAALAMVSLMKELSRSRGFVARWFATMAGLAQGANRWGEALDWAERGTREVADAAELQLVLGSLQEAIGQEFRELEDDRGLLTADAGGLRAHVLDVQEGPRLLGAARQAFRAALARDGSLTEARLRLGHVEYLLGDNSAAERAYDDVLEHEPKTAVGFLAHLYLGRLEEDGRRLVDARRSYESALALEPRCQSAHVALSHVLLQTGDVASARKEVEAALEAAGQRTRLDPYWLYPWIPSVKAETELEALRREASS